MTSSRAAPAIISIMRSATSSCTNNSRSAEQRWPAERNAEVTTSSATCSGSAVASTIIALMPPVSAISGTIGPSLAASARLIVRATSVEPVKTTPAMSGCATSARADPAVARHQMQRRRRHAGFMQQPHGFSRDQRRLLGRLRDDGVAGHQRRRDLAQKDRQRKIPRRDRDEDAAAAQAQHVALAGRSRHRLAFAEQFAALRGVVAAEIDGLADFRERVVQRLAALALQQRDEMRRALFQQIGGLLQRGCARARPAFWLQSLETVARGRDRRIRLRLGRVGDASRRGQWFARRSAETSCSNAARSPNSMPREFFRCGR